jgi:tetratricopeptide (TPR) repeat protein
VALERGDARGLSRAAAELGRVGDAERWLPAKVYALQWRGTIALLEGRFDEAEAYGDDMLAQAELLRDVVGLVTVQNFYLTRERGREANLGGMELAAKSYSDSSYVQAMLAVTQLDVGDVPAARRSLDAAAAKGFALGTESGSTAAMALFAEVAAGCRAPAHAEALIDLLDPFQGRLLSALLGLACLGAADRVLGMLATVLERWDDAEEHFGVAEALEEGVGGRALLTRTQFWHARLLEQRGRARGAPGDHDAAVRKYSTVAAEASALGMTRLAEQARNGGREA